MNNTTTVPLLGRQFQTIRFIFWLYSWFAVSGQLRRERGHGWRTYWHDYCRTRPLVPTSSFMMGERAAAVLAGFYPVICALKPLPLVLYFSPFLLISNNCQRLYFYPPPPLPNPAWLYSKCTYCPHFLLVSLSADFRVGSSSATQGPVNTREDETTSASPTIPRQCAVFKFRK